MRCSPGRGRHQRATHRVFDHLRVFGRSALAAYRALPARAGWGYLIATSLGRLPLSMMPLAILTLATASTGSIALAGVAAAAAVGEAIGAPTGGALSDRFGQRPVLLTGVVLNVGLAVAFVATIAEAPDLLIVALAGATGLSPRSARSRACAGWR